jgi:hypothetical protein
VTRTLSRHDDGLLRHDDGLLRYDDGLFRYDDGLFRYDDGVPGSARTAGDAVARSGRRPLRCPLPPPGRA